MKISFDESLALIHYYAHKTDKEIGKQTGVPSKTIANWRTRRGLKNISPTARKAVIHVGATGGVDYRTALEPEQAKEMGRFLHALLWAGDKAVQAGEKPDVGCFMKCWIGKAISDEEKLQQARNYNKDYMNRKRAAVAQ
jgi:hypothetical protein